MATRKLRMRFGGLFILFVATMAFAGKTSSDLPVTTYLSDFNAVGEPYYVFSDGDGAYKPPATALGLT